MGKRTVRNVQHRPEREERKAKEVADLKRENNNLRRQLARMRKQLAKILEREDEAIDEQAVVVAPPIGQGPTCECGSTQRSMIKGPTKTYLFCSGCKKRLGEVDTV